jgi:hypothetical protein
MKHLKGKLAWLSWQLQRFSYRRYLHNNTALPQAEETVTTT